MVVVKEQKSSRCAAELAGFAVKAPQEERPSQPFAALTYQPVEVEAEYGCVDWYQYQIEPEKEETRH